MHRSARPLVAVTAVLVLLLGACGGGGGSGGADRPDPGGGSGAPGELSGDITVAAAASLTEGFTQLGEDFEALHPGTDVQFNFDSSGSLSDGILTGAPADVFASADEENMAKLAAAERTDGDPTVFARNQLVIVTKPGNPEGIEDLADLADVGVVSLCGPDAPCGTFAAQVLEDAGVEIPSGSVTLGQNVKATLTAVSEGDAVAGIVYATDGRAAGEKVDVVAIPQGQNAVATYPIAALQDAGEPDVAAAFVAYVASDEGQQVLEELGFLAPA